MHDTASRKCGGVNRECMTMLELGLKESKGKFLCSAVSSPRDRSKRFTLYFPDRPVHSDTISSSLGSIQPYAIINAQRRILCCGVKTLGKVFHSTLLQFTQLYK